MFIIIYGIITIILCIVIVSATFFISRKLSPVPYFPSNWKDLKPISEILLKNVKKRNTSNIIRDTRYEIPDTLIDLGAGTGTVIFHTARQAYQKKLSIQFVAVEIHPLLILIMHLKRLFHPNKKNIIILRTDMFAPEFYIKLSKKKFLYNNDTMKQLSNITIYIYIGLFVMDRMKKILKSFPKNTQIISYMYKIPGWEKKLISTKKALHNIYTYTI